jgi:hypothetical protein
LPERAAAGAELEIKAHPHMLRHACGYALANKGHDTRAIQGWQKLELDGRSRAAGEPISSTGERIRDKDCGVQAEGYVDGRPCLAWL